MEQNKSEFIENFKTRTKKISLRTIKLFQCLPKTEESRIIGRQLLRSATSVGANYRAVCRARSKKEFYAKLSIVVEEADETLFWIEFLIESKIMQEERMLDLKNEVSEILAVLSKARKSLN